MAAKGRIVRKVFYFSQAIPVVPGILRDLCVLCGESAAVVGVDESGDSVALSVIEIVIRAIGEQPIVLSDKISATDAVSICIELSKIKPDFSLH